MIITSNKNILVSGNNCELSKSLNISGVELFPFASLLKTIISFLLLKKPISSFTSYINHFHLSKDCRIDSLIKNHSQSIEKSFHSEIGRHFNLNLPKYFQLISLEKLIECFRSSWSVELDPSSMKMKILFVSLTILSVASAKIQSVSDNQPKVYPGFTKIGSYGEEE